jgi:hypothetical protein
LPDDAGNAIWPVNLGPECRILICHEILDKASDFLFEITQHFTGNTLLMALFPECVPNPKFQRMNKYELELPGHGRWKEPTFDTMGIGGRSQGAHYNYLKLDDLIGDKARDSEADMQKAKDWIDNVQAFFSKFKEDRFDLIGTRWANDDLYSHVEDKYGKKLGKYRRKVEEWDAKLGKKVPIFPEEVDTDSLEILKKNRKVYAAQYENDPDSSSNKFKKQWLRWFVWQTPKVLSVFGDGSTDITKEALKNENTPKRLINLSNTNIVFLVDPGGTVGFNVVAIDSLSRCYILESHEAGWSDPELADTIFRKASQYHPKVVAIEADFFASVYEHWFKAEMRLRNQKFNIEPILTLKKQKETRVHGCATYLSSGQWFFNETFYTKERDQEYSDLIYEIIKFGSLKKYHALDSLAYLTRPEILVPFRKNDDENQNKKNAAEANNRDKTTGYSQIQLVRR